MTCISTWAEQTYLFLSLFRLPITITSICSFSFESLGRESVPFPDTDPPQLVQILKVLCSQFNDSPCSAVAVVIVGSCKRILVAVEEAPQTVVRVYINLRTLLAVRDGLGQVLRPDRKCLTTAKTGATKSGYTSVCISIAASRCWACCRK
jgi:hypothetical protein